MVAASSSTPANVSNIEQSGDDSDDDHDDNSIIACQAEGNTIESGMCLL